jgi:hypothetical protein
MPNRWTFGAVVWIAVTGCAPATYRRAAVDSSGQLRITMSNGREIAPRKDSAQVGFDKVAISADGRIVGWLALYPNCCTTYPVPLKLVLLAGGTERAISGNDLPLWQWSFTPDGQRVALRQAPVHGTAGTHFELRDIRTGGLVSSFDADSSTAAGAPGWVRALRSPP